MTAPADTSSLPPASADAKPQRGIQSLDSTGDLLAALVAAARPLTLRDLAAAAGMPPAKAFPHLVSLLKIGLLSRDASGCFEAGPLALELGLIGLQRLSPTREAGPEVVELAASTAMSVAMAVLGPLGPTVVRLEESARPLHVSLRVGTVMSLVNTAIGRVFAAYVADDVRAGLLAQDHLRLAGANAADALADKHGPKLKEAYAQRLAQIRAGGMDSALSRPVPGIDTLAAPVFDHTGSICLVLALMGPSGSFDSDATGEPAQTLCAATLRLSRRFGWMGAG
ncbi:IclR family transcriptional regulator [Paraburkholderia kirstenboschensis]|uniref:Helix-turn-helix domain-containing protein n=1 Tax=Paraburkholderia kirstenboschensis TaxID=1245436 RepID=A0ABZ0EI10_9BURK|nr:helix-turn-helix domain-containing protein [Paraburkholderia kirstenboschensis]WOD16857.1 helix-turn-helix domain-containing protein [Paraburkholderia kirstenboschensis]